MFKILENWKTLDLGVEANNKAYNYQILHRHNKVPLSLLVFSAHFLTLAVIQFLGGGGDTSVWTKSFEPFFSR